MDYQALIGQALGAYSNYQGTKAKDSTAVQIAQVQAQQQAATLAAQSSNTRMMLMVGGGLALVLVVVVIATR